MKLFHCVLFFIVSGSCLALEDSPVQDYPLTIKTESASIVQLIVADKNPSTEFGCDVYFGYKVLTDDSGIYKRTPEDTRGIASNVLIHKNLSLNLEHPDKPIGVTAWNNYAVIGYLPTSWAYYAESGHKIAIPQEFGNWAPIYPFVTFTGDIFKSTDEIEAPARLTNGPGSSLYVTWGSGVSDYISENGEKKSFTPVQSYYKATQFNRIGYGTISPGVIVRQDVYRSFLQIYNIPDRTSIYIPVPDVVNWCRTIPSLSIIAYKEKGKITLLDPNGKEIHSEDARDQWIAFGWNESPINRDGILGYSELAVLENGYIAFCKTEHEIAVYDTKARVNVAKVESASAINAFTFIDNRHLLIADVNNRLLLIPIR